jgi:hypothetical protein
MIRSVCKSKMIKPSNKQGKQVIWQVIIKKINEIHQLFHSLDNEWSLH